METWKDIPEFEGYYQVSNKGRVKSLDRMIDDWRGCLQERKGKIKKIHLNGYGYQIVTLCKNGNCKQFFVHLLVARAFLNLESNRYQTVIDHIDNNKLNNRAENLQLLSHADNIRKGKKGYTYLKDRKRYLVRVYHKGTNYYIGTFKTETEAIKQRNKALKKIIKS